MVNLFGNVAAQRRKKFAASVEKERRESLVRAKRYAECYFPQNNNKVVIGEDQSVLYAQTMSIVEEFKNTIAYQGKGAVQKRVGALRELRRLLSRSEFPPMETALNAGAIPLLVRVFHLLLEAVWCLTNIAAGRPEETRALIPVLPLFDCSSWRERGSEREDCAEEETVPDRGIQTPCGGGSEYVEKTWKIMDHAIHEIYNHNASGLSFEELYRLFN